MRGGYRAGAGRKRGFAAKLAEDARILLSERVAQEIGPISDALISKAKNGDIRAVHELFDRAWGRARQAIEIIVDNEEAERTPEQQERIQKLSVWMNEIHRGNLMDENPSKTINQFREWQRMNP
ncbi:MAG: hypothetical protein NT108_03630 [Candidatus Kaiserbacteria bacterium]|nr:hypothetical protein [Candidatus Kaiserbacteria bacterium]